MAHKIDLSFFQNLCLPCNLWREVKGLYDPFCKDDYN